MSRLPRLRRHDEIPVSELQRRSNPVRFGIWLIVVLAIVLYFGFTKHIPFKHGFRLNAVFNTAVNIHSKSPVRIAGVDVGKVTAIRREGSAGLVTMEIEGKGLPIHRDATLKIRPRLFLEGNFFVEVQPGSPSAPALSSGATIPLAQTSDPVQLDQVLDALNTDTRANLQTALVELGAALTRKPTPAQDAEQEPIVQGLNGAQAFNKAFQLGPEALRNNAIVAQAFAGTEEDDLAKLLVGLERVTGALDVHEQQLGELVVNFNTTMGAVAAQAPSLRTAVAELPAALRSTDHGLAEFQKASPAIRTFALNLIPALEEAPSTITASFPWIDQFQTAFGPNELGGVATALQAFTPPLASLIGGQAAFFSTFDQFNQCLTKVFFPALDTKVQDGPNTTGVEAYREFWYALAGLAGLGQNFDGNGAADRFLVGGAGSAVVSPPATIVNPTSPHNGVRLVAQASLAPEGTSPRFTGSEPPYKPLVPCDTQTLPNFNGPLAHGPADGTGG
jgi:phospholipid/cholesterol/gamma-HCH transport system substrate-binding protein